MKKVSKYELRELILTGQDITKVDYSDIKEMIFMFSNTDLKTIPWIDTSNVIDMNGMFDNCNNLRTIPLLDTSNVGDIANMFRGCFKLKNIPDLDTSKVYASSFAFQNCYSLELINHWKFPDYDWTDTQSTNLRLNYPELFI
jgi:hypothetical protein